MVPLTLIVPSILAAISAGGLIAYKTIKKDASDSNENKKLKDAFQVAMHSIKFDMKDVKSLITNLKKAGFKEEADQLKKRIELTTLDEETKEKRQLAVKNALSSADKDKILQLALTFEKEGAHATATRLRQYAKGLP